MKSGCYTLREAIINKINSENKKLSEGDRKVGTAVWSPADRQDFPSVIVLQEDAESDYHETGERSRQRTFVYRVYIMEEITQNRPQTQIEKDLSRGCDFLINTFDKEDVFSNDEKKEYGIEDMIWIEPVPSIWGTVDWEGGKARVATITLRCLVMVDED